MQEVQMSPVFTSEPTCPSRARARRLQYSAISMATRAARGIAARGQTSRCGQVKGDTLKGYKLKRIEKTRKYKLIQTEEWVFVWKYKPQTTPWTLRDVSVVFNTASKVVHPLD